MLVDIGAKEEYSLADFPCLVALEYTALFGFFQYQIDSVMFTGFYGVCVCWDR